jgi:hypothetical protein
MNENCIKLAYDKSIFYKVLNARSIQISSNVSYINAQKDKEDNIISLDLGGIHTITIKDKFEIKLLDRVSYYSINYIEEGGNNSYILLSHQRNKSTVYLLPMLGMYKTFYTGEYNVNYEGYLINCYITEDYKFLNLLYRFSTYETYKLLEGELMQHKQFVKHIDLKEYVVYKFKIPEVYLEDVNLFLHGKYSKMNNIYKNKIIAFNGYMPNHRVSSTLFKKEPLKRHWENYLDLKFDEHMELESKPNLKEEQFYEQIC